MRFTLRSSCFIAVVLCNAKFSLETDDFYSSRKSLISRRAIDGTRGRKYYDPTEDGFYDDYSFDGGQYEADQDRLDLEDIRKNVPGEPGVDYPAYQRLPQTSFSCTGRVRGYYADEEAGCQLFHVCDEVLVSSFLCPVGSVFSQKLLTCDWWNKVDCSLTRKFYEANRHIYDQDDDEMLRKAYAMTSLRVGSFIEERKDRDKDGKLVTFVAVERTGNDLPNSFEDVPAEPDYRAFSPSQDNYHEHVLYSQDYRTKPPKIYQDSPIVRIHKITDDHRIAYESQTRNLNQNAYHRPINEFENEFQPSYAPTVPTVTTTTRRFYSPTVPIAYRSSTPSYSKHDQSFLGSKHSYTHRDDSQILPTVPTVFYREKNFHPTPNPVGEIRNVDVTHYSQKSTKTYEDYEEEFDEDMEVRESIGLAQSKDERLKNNADRTQSLQDNKEVAKFEVNLTKNSTEKDVEEGTRSSINDSSKSLHSSEFEKDLGIENPKVINDTDYQSQSTIDHLSTLPPQTTQTVDIVVQHHSTRGVKIFMNDTLSSTVKSEIIESTESTKAEETTTDIEDSVSSSTLKSMHYTISEHTFDPIQKPAEILEPPETSQGFRINVPDDIFNTVSTQRSNLLAEFSTIEYRPYSSSGNSTSFVFSTEQENSSHSTTNLFGRFTTPSPLPVSHLPTINIPATEITPPFTNLFAGGHYGTVPVNEFKKSDNLHSNVSSSQNDTKANVDTSSVKPVIPLFDLEPPDFNHRISNHENDQKSDVESSTKDSITETTNYFATEKPADFTRTVVTNKETDSPYRVTLSENFKNVDELEDDTYSRFDNVESYTEDYEEKYKSDDYVQDGVNYSMTDERVETSTEIDLSDRVLNLFQIMAELAKTNRFPRPFMHNEPLIINLRSTTTQPDDNSSSSEFLNKLSHTQKIFMNRSESNLKNNQDKDFQHPVYKHEEHKTESTVIPSAEDMTVESNYSVDSGAITTSRSTVAQSVRSVVETEFVPSLGFSLDTEQGRDEFAEAVRRGLVTIDDKSRREFLTSTQDSKTRDKDEVEE